MADKSEERYEATETRDELLRYERLDMALLILCIRNNNIASIIGGQREIL